MGEMGSLWSVETYQTTFPMPRRFEINTKALLLTYSQLNDDEQQRFFEVPTSHYDFVVDTLGDPVCYRLGRERHQDGGFHAHCYVSFASAVRIRSERRLDFGGSHPNIQSVRTGHRRTWEYAGKENDIILDFGVPPDESRSRSSSSQEVWHEIVGKESEAEFYDACRTLAPFYFVLYRSNLERYCAWRYGSERTEYSSPEFDADPPDAVIEWLEQARLGHRGGPRRRSLILWGPSLTGKTVWARSLGRYAPMWKGGPPGPP